MHFPDLFLPLAEQPVEGVGLYLVVSFNDLLRKATKIAFGEWTNQVFMSIGLTAMGCVGLWLIKVGMNSELMAVVIIGVIVSVIGFGLALFMLKTP